jgi:arylsulfatase A-like enzyme
MKISTTRRLAPAIAVLFAAGISPLPAADIAPRPPNIVVFLADDLGARDIRANNPATFYDTPNIDRLAGDGMRFTDGYAACPVCSPSRAAVLTGKYPQRPEIGVTDYIGAAQPEKWSRKTPLLPAAYREYLPLEELTLAERLKPAGYATFFAGKWHLGPEGKWPENQGFDVNKGGIDRGGPYGGKKYFSPYENPRLPDGPPGEHLPDRLAREAVSFMETNRSGPFLVYLSFYDVHTPLMAREDLRLKYEERAKNLPKQEPRFGREGERDVRLVQDHAVYAGMVDAMDQAVGKVLDALDRLKLSDRTIVVFTSDNGGLSTSEGSPTSNQPLRAGKGWLYEGGVRVPLIVRAPGVTRAGKVSAVPAAGQDLVPTLLDLAGLPAPRGVDGVSLTPALRGKKMAERPLFWHYPHYGNQGGAPGGAVRLGDWKLIVWYEDDRAELYNLDKDPGEQRDLAKKNPAKALELRNLLESWRAQTRGLMPQRR